MGAHPGFHRGRGSHNYNHNHNIQCKSLAVIEFYKRSLLIQSKG